MSAIDDLFAKLRKEGRKALMPFVTAGDPDLDFTAAVLQELVKRGSSLCELGIPYSDPIADGPVIQASYTRALEHKIKLAEILKMAGGVVPKLAAPVVTMVSYAIVYRHGLEQYVADAQKAGMAGHDRARSVGRRSRSAGEDLPRRRFQSDSTGHARPRRRIGPSGLPNRAPGFIYYVRSRALPASGANCRRSCWTTWPGCASKRRCRSASALASARRST